MLFYNLYIHVMKKYLYKIIIEIKSFYYKIILDRKIKRLRLRLETFNNNLNRI